MDMMPFEDFDVLEAQVHDMVRQHDLPPDVRRVEVRFGDRWDGEPAMWMELFIPEDRRLSPAEAEQWAGVMQSLSAGARPIIGHRIPAVRFLVDRAQG